VKCSCLNRMAHLKGSSNLLSRTRIQGLDLRERGRGAQALDLRERGRGAQALDLRECLAFSEWPMTQEGRWGLFIVPTANRVVGERIH
jgi:hypothetical protein